MRNDRHDTTTTFWPAMTEPFDGWREFDAYEFGQEGDAPRFIPSDSTPELTGELDWGEEEINAALDRLDSAA